MEGNMMSTNQLIHIERELNRFMRRKNNFRPGAMIRSTARDFERQFTINLEGMPPKEVAVRNPIRLPRPKLAPKYRNILPKRRMEDDNSLQRQPVEETIMELDESSEEKLNLEKEMAQLYLSQKKLSDFLPIVLNDFNQLTTAINRIKAMTPDWHGETSTPENEYEDEQQANDGRSFGLPELRAHVNHLFQTQKEYSNLIDYFKASLDAVNALLNQVRERINQTLEEDSQLKDETLARSPIKMRMKVTQKRLDDGSVSKSYEVFQNVEKKNKSLKEP
ncbi:hypothetical protein ACTXT7_014047 [Hymenolepis weldensis]